MPKKNVGVGMKTPDLNVLKKTIFLFVFGLVAVSFVNCSPNSSTPSSLPTPNSELNTVSAWDAPVGELVPLGMATLQDGWYDLRYVADPVNVPGGWTDSAAISRDGKSLYFAYMRYSFSDLIDNGLLNPNGPFRPGMTGNAMKNFRADLTSSGWQVSFLPINGDINQNEGSASTNLNQDFIVFDKFDPSGQFGTIFFSRKVGGAWTSPVQLPAPINNSNCSNDNAFVIGDSANGYDIYFDSNRSSLACTGTSTSKHIYHSYYNPSTNSASAVSLVPGINGTNSGDEDHQPFLSTDKKQIVWTVRRAMQYGVYTADIVGGVYANVRPIIELAPNFSLADYTGNLVFLGEGNIAETDQGSLLYMICGVATKNIGQTKGAELKVCRAKKNRSF